MDSTTRRRGKRLIAAALIAATLTVGGAITVTGHSLGGGLATAATDLHNEHNEPAPAQALGFIDGRYGYSGWDGGFGS